MAAGDRRRHGPELPTSRRPLWRDSREAVTALAVLMTSSASSSPVMTGATGGERSEHKRAMGNRFVARDAHTSGQRARAIDAQRTGGGRGVGHLGTFAAISASGAA